MGWLDFFAGKDPSESWALTRRFTPELNLRDHSLCSLPLGGAPDALQRFGKPDNRRPFKDGLFVYGQSGVLVELVQGKIGYFAIALEEDLLDHLQPTRGRLIRADGASMELGEATTVSGLRHFLACEPATDTDDVEIVDTFTLDGYILEVEAHLDGRVKRINLFGQES